MTRVFIGLTFTYLLLRQAYSWIGFDGWQSAYGYLLKLTSYHLLLNSVSLGMFLAFLIGLLLYGVVSKWRSWRSDTYLLQMSSTWIVFAWLSVFFGNFALDLNPYLATAFLWSLPAFFEQPWRILQTKLHLARMLYLGCLVGGFLWQSIDLTDQLLLCAWGGWGMFCIWKSHWSAHKEYLLGVMGVWLFFQCLSVFHFNPAPASTLMDANSNAYTSCEIPGTSRLLAAVPMCEGFYQEECKQGHLLEFDTQTKQLVQKIHFFDDSFYGRMVYLLCLPSEVHIGMVQSVVDGKRRIEHVTRWDLNDPQPPQTALWEHPSAGHRMAHDPVHDRIYYVSEFQPDLFQYDVASQTVRQDIGSTYLPNEDQWHRQSLGLDTYGVHTQRESLFVGEWLWGNRIYEMDLTTFAWKHEWLPGNMGNHGILVDETYDRLYVTDFLGVAIFDLSTKAMVSKKRLRFGNRTPVVSHKHGLVFIPSMVGGRIYVLDQASMTVLGMLSEFGVRLPWVSLDQDVLYASGYAGYFYWNIQDIATHFKGQLRGQP